MPNSPQPRQDRLKPAYPRINNSHTLARDLIFAFPMEGPGSILPTSFALNSIGPKIAKLPAKTTTTAGSWNNTSEGMGVLPNVSGLGFWATANAAFLTRITSNFSVYARWLITNEAVPNSEQMAFMNGSVSTGYGIGIDSSNQFCVLFPGQNLVSSTVTTTQYIGKIVDLTLIVKNTQNNNLWLNGVNIITANNSAISALGAASATAIGGRNVPDDILHGTVLDIRMWKRPLTDGEIRGQHFDPYGLYRPTIAQKAYFYDASTPGTPPPAVTNHFLTMMGVGT